MKNVLPLLKKTLFLFVFAFGFLQGNAQDICATTKCKTSNDLYLEKAFLGTYVNGVPTELPADYECNGTADLEIFAVFNGSASAPRYSLQYGYYLELGGNTSSRIYVTDCLFPKQPILKNTPIEIGKITDWVCGEEVKLINFFMSWQTANKDCDCNNNCARVPEVYVSAPLVPKFDIYSTCLPGKTFETYTFTDKTAGGKQPYNISWDFGDDAGTPVVNGDDYTVEYTTGGVKTVTLTATDADGITKTAVSTISVEGCCNLAITCPAGSPFTRVTGNNAKYTVSGTEFDPTVADMYCDEVDLSNNLNSSESLAGYQLAPGTHTIIWTATATGQTAKSCTISVTVNDNYNPTVTCPGNIPKDSDTGSCSATFAPAVTTYSDNVGVVHLTWAITGVTSATSPATGINQVGSQAFNKGISTVTFTAKDAAGNSAVCSYTVTVTDKQAPTITKCAPDVTVNTDAGKCETAKSNVTLGLPEATDNCDGAMTIANMTNNAPNIFPKGETTVTWTVTDASGNSSTCTQKVTVVDNEKPVPTCFVPTGTYPADQGQNYATVNFSSTAKDNCTANPTIEYYIGTTKITSTYQFPLGPTTVKTVARDEKGNEGECTFTIVVGDGQAPVFTSCPVNITKDTDLNLCSASVVTPSPVYTDNVGVVTLTWVITGATAATSPASGINLVGTRTFDKGTSTVKYTAYDGSGNTATCQFTVTVNDKQAPKIDKCAADKTVFTDNTKCTTALANVDLGTVEASDNCGSIKSITNNAPTTFNIGVNNVTWTVMDGSGNTATCIQKITVVDNQKPVPVCFSPATSYGTDADKDYATVTFASTATDNCGMKSIEYFIGATKITSSYQFPLGSTTVKTVATDIYDNKEECTFTINVTDGQAPSFTTCQGNVIKSTDAGKCHASVATVNPVATDNKGVVTLTWVVTGATAATSSASGINYVGTMNFDKGVSTVKYTAKDAAGNSALCTFTVTVEDKEAPVITCATPVNTIVIPPATGYLAGTELDPTTFSDNCPGATLTNNINGKASLSGHLFTQEGTTTITWTATDAANNTKQCTTSLTFFLGDCVVNGACGKTFVVELFPVRVRTTTVYRGYLDQAEVLSMIYSRCEPTEQLQVTFEKTVFTPKDWGDQNFIWVKVYSPFQNKTVTCDIKVIVRYPTKSGDMLANNPGEFGYENTNVDVSVYPNPTTGKFKIDIWNLNDPNVNAVIYNVNGAVVMQKQVTTTGEVDMDLRGNVPGLYLLRLVADKREFYHKIILENR